MIVDFSYSFFLSFFDKYHFVIEWVFEGQLYANNL